MKQPVPLVKFTLECVCVLLGEKTEWSEIQKVLAKVEFLNRVKNYDRDNIPSKLLVNLRKKMQGNSDFTPEKVKSTSDSAGSLCL